MSKVHLSSPPCRIWDRFESYCIFLEELTFFSLFKNWHFANFEFFSKFRTAVYPLNKAQIGAKLWQNAFQTICNFSFFDAEKNIGPKKFKKMEVNFCFQETGVLEELGRFERHWHVRRKKLLPLMRLFLGRLPWRGGKRLNMCRKPGLGTKNDFNHLVLWW